MRFSKYAGCGNDFILVDNRKVVFPVTDRASHIRKICHRHTGIGADGVILLEESLSADFKMRIFNADGSEAEMCGNGIRCLHKFIQKLGLCKQAVSIETLESILSLKQAGDEVTVEMPIPSELSWSIPLSVNNQDLEAHHLNTGVPHAVFFLPEIESVDVNRLGRQIRFDSHFSPRGANVNFVSVADRGIAIRTYERGVEQETLACGTGATAAALAAAHVKQLPSPIRVHTRSGEVLTIDFKLDDAKISNVTMTGPATHVFDGEI